MQRVCSNMSLAGTVGSVMIQLLIMATLVDMRSHGFAIKQQPDALVDTGQDLVAKEITLAHVPRMRYSTTVKGHAIPTNINNHHGKTFENNLYRTHGSNRLHRNIYTSKLERHKKVTVFIPRSRLETVADNLLMESQSRDTVMIIENKPKLSTFSSKQQETATSKPEQKSTENYKITGEDNSSSYSTQPVNLTKYTSAFTPITLESQYKTNASFKETNNKSDFGTKLLEKEIIEKEYTKKPAETKRNETELIGTRSLKTSVLITPTSQNSTNATLTTPLFEKVSSGRRLQNTETFTQEGNSVSIVPSWKKYSVIDRKPVTKALDADVVISQQELVTTKYSGVGFSNVSENDTKNLFVNSLESVRTLKPDIRRRHKKDEKYETTSQMSSVAETTELTTTKIYTEMPEILSSKRGGYLNHSAKQYDAVKTVEDEDSSDYYAPIPKKKLDATDIQNKMIEDAILSEEKMNDEENARLFRANFANSDDTSSTMLAVKPIVNINKNTTLYAVNPNYKPLKKLEVQPPKSYVRDPDDNSWRNESINSLGIVFKPKNSSKPLTQVLKDKTESEIINLTEKKEITSELPELRERLEKLTVMRKIKKNKHLSNEELSDTDYKDFKIDWFLKDLTSTTTIKPFIDEFVYPNTEDKLTQKLKPKTIFEYYENTMTTVKPVEPKKKKTKLVVDYYDNVYDHDDFTLQDIDLKRYPVTKPSIVMQEKTTSTTTNAPIQKKQKIEREKKPLTQKNLQAERRPTLEYFPPRLAQKLMDSEFYPKYEDQFSFSGETELAFPPNTLPQVTSLKTTTQIPSNNKLYYTTQTTPKVEPYVDQHSNYIAHAGRLFDELQRFYLSANTSPRPEQEHRATLKAGEAEDYAEQFHRGGQQYHHVIDKFLQNFQENNEKFKVDYYPVVYNHSVVHKADPEGNKVVSSVAFMRQLFDDDVSIEPPSTKRSPRHQKHFLDQTKAFDPEQEKTIELLPDYELHYYIPEEEQSESITVPNN